MILETDKTLVKSNGIVDTTEFTILANAKMFNMLTDKLYSNKIKSIVRELSSNAWDSHVEAGHKRQFEVHCPTNIEPYFSIRDFGLGLSPEKVKEVYTVLGMSDKTESNEFVGCLGIGSKSPFSYTNNFSVISYNNGLKSIYCCYKNEEGIPAISLLSQEKSNEPTGLKIEISVKQDDVFSWKSEIQDNYHYYDVSPKCNITLKEFKKNLIFTIDNINIYEVIHDSSKRYVKILMGHNIYSIEKVYNNIEFDLPYNTDLVIEVPIGSISVDISRERIEFDTKTDSFLNKLFNKLKHYYLDETQKKIDESKSVYEAIQCSKSFRKDSTVNLRNIDMLLTYNGNTISNLKWKTYKSEFTLYKLHLNCKSKKYNSFQIDGNNTFVIDDIKTSHINYSNNYLNNDNTRCLFFKPKDKLNECIKFLEDCGVPKRCITFTSNLVKKTKGSYSPTKLMYLNESVVIDTKILPTENDYYTLREGNSINLTIKERKIISFLKLKVYCLTKTQVSKFKCKKIEDELPNIISDYLSKNNVKQNYSSIIFSNLQLCNKLLSINPNLQTYIDKYKKYTTEADKVRKLIPNNIVDVFLSKLPIQNLNIDEEIERKYPLFKILDISYNIPEDCKQDLINYFKEKDNVISSNQN